MTPGAGDSAFTLAAMFPGSITGDVVRPTPRSDGTTDLSIAQELFHDHFSQDVPEAPAARMAVTQRPATREALTEPSGVRRADPRGLRGRSGRLTTATTSKESSYA